MLLITDRTQEFTDVLAALRNQLFNVLIEHQGWDAYNRAKATVPNAILLDADMQSMDGILVFRLLKRVPVLARTPLIVLSRSMDASSRGKLLEEGASDCLSWPLYPQELILRLTLHCRLARQVCEATQCWMILAPTSNTDPVQLALAHIDHPQELVRSTLELANRVGVGKRKLSMLFKNKTGVSMSQYLLLHRMENAAWLLKNTQLSIGEISIQAGFRSACNFSVAFQQYASVSPSAYRRQAVAPARCEPLAAAHAGADMKSKKISGQEKYALARR